MSINENPLYSHRICLKLNHAIRRTASRLVGICMKSGAHTAAINGRPAPINRPHPDRETAGHR
jgi:hypothetical protein